MLPISILTFYSSDLVLTPSLDSRLVKQRGVGVPIVQPFDSGLLRPIALFFSPEVLQLGLDTRDILAILLPALLHEV